MSTSRQYADKYINYFELNVKRYTVDASNVTLSERFCKAQLFIQE